MWKLNPVGAGGESYYLLPDAQYVVGRKNCEVLLQDDQSISRVHANLAVSARNSNQNEPPAFSVKDSSKYGTFVNEERLTNDTPTVLKSGDRLTFGVFNSKFRVEYEPLVVCSSCVDSAGKADLLQAVQLLGGHMVNNWTQDCTHLVMSSVKVTIKTICALVCCRPIVKPEFFFELRRALQQKLPPPKAENFCPEIDEPTLNKEDVDLNVRPERRSLFRGKTFIFLNAKQQKRLSAAVSFGGGRSQLLEEGSLPVSILGSPGSRVVDAATGNSQTLLPASTKKWSDDVGGVLHRKGLRFIAESEIGLATIYISTDIYCNPLSKMDSETVRTKAMIPSATMSQNMTVDETVLPVASQNITAYAPNTEPSQSVSSLCRMGTSGLSAVSETPVKEQRSDRPSRKGATANDSPTPCTTAKTVMSSYSTDGGASPVVPREKASLTARPKCDNPTALKSPLTEQKQSSPQKQSSLTNYFQSVSKKRTREGSDPADQCEAKHSKVGPEEEEPSEPCFAPPAPRGQSDGPGPGPGPGPSRESQRDRPVREASQRPTSIKRKEIASPQPAEEMDMDDLELIMSQPMEGLESQAATSKKRRLEPAAEIKEEEVFFTGASNPDEGTEVLMQRGEPGPKSTSVKEEAEDPRAAVKGENGEDLPKSLLLVQFTSLVVGDPLRPRPSALQPLDSNRNNFKKFRKVPVPGTQGLPNIIGGSDLVAHNKAKNSELEEWLRESAEEDQHNKRDEAVGDDLFRYNPKPSKRR
ncbi:hypothetical protein AAFF_G00164260 [Aldrovandia affinis]|uniref:Nibrin n=1 Tax=Aldrovandia affinis TaxID=143900 RepID=A0AAD7T061_9TELE|nr:hypothetical protein AAFF_G00164260 [Aldrovandia affinis]